MAKYRCPKCRGTRFSSTAHVTQNWELDENGNFSKCLTGCIDVTHYPNDEDIWDCSECGYSAEGKKFKIPELNSHAIISMELVRDFNGLYYVNLSIDGVLVKGLPEYISYRELKSAVKKQCDITLPKLSDLKFEYTGHKWYATKQWTL